MGGRESKAALTTVGEGRILTLEDQHEILGVAYPQNPMIIDSWGILRRDLGAPRNPFGETDYVESHPNAKDNASNHQKEKKLIEEELKPSPHPNSKVASISTSDGVIKRGNVSHALGALGAFVIATKLYFAVKPFTAK